jgi:hypothetical protein
MHVELISHNLNLYILFSGFACNITLLNERTTYRNQFMRVRFIILHCTTCFGL